MTALQKFFVSLSILTLGLLGFEEQSFLHDPTFAQAQNIPKIPVALPENVTVNLKSKKQISGVRLLEINASTQQIKLGQGSNTETKDIANIDSLAFSGRAKLKGGKIVIRGGGNSGSSCSNSESWDLPLNDFRLKDSRQAELFLSSLPRHRQGEIEGINQVRTYVVDEMKFAYQGKVTLKTTPCSSN